MIPQTGEEELASASGCRAYGIVLVWQKWSPYPNSDQHGPLETRGWLRQMEAGSFGFSSPN